MIDLEAFPADHVFPAIAHLLEKGFVGLDHVHVRGHDQDKVLDPVDEGLHLARAFPQFALLAADGLPEDSEHGVGQDADAGRPGGEDIFEHARVGRQNDDEVDLVPGIVEVVVIRKGLQAQAPGQENTRAGWVRVGDGDDRRLDLLLLDHGGRPFQNFRAQCAAADQCDIDDGEGIFHRGIVPGCERYPVGAEEVKVSGAARG